LASEQKKETQLIVINIFLDVLTLHFVLSRKVGQSIQGYIPNECYAVSNAFKKQSYFLSCIYTSFSLFIYLFSLSLNYLSHLLYFFPNISKVRESLFLKRKFQKWRMNKIKTNEIISLIFMETNKKPARES